mmetsp:Transcript_7188/g.17503  ORF Transcript_7188/g.17503 Transcript_7188/m.17503 type:complete len:93 (+) Transcript_7188:1372-1650(+)
MGGREKGKRETACFFDERREGGTTQSTVWDSLHRLCVLVHLLLWCVSVSITKQIDSTNCNPQVMKRRMHHCHFWPVLLLCLRASHREPALKG